MGNKLTRCLVSIIATLTLTSPTLAEPIQSLPLKVWVSPDTVSTWTEVQAGDTLLANSQVFVGRDQTLTQVALGGFGMGSTKMRNESAAAAPSGRLSLKFVEETKAALLAAQTQGLATLSLQSAGDAYDLSLLPSARLDVQDERGVMLGVRLTARVRMEGKGEHTRNYYFRGAEVHPIAGTDSWSENDGARLRDSTAEALKFLVKAMILDVTGQFEARLAGGGSAAQQFYYSNGVGYTAIALGDIEGNIVQAPAFKGRVMKNVVFVADPRQALTSKP